MALDTHNCSKCYYFTPEDDLRIGYCHRYPKASEVYDDHFCGEFKVNPLPPHPEKKNDGKTN